MIELAIEELVHLLVMIPWIELLVFLRVSIYISMASGVQVLCSPDRVITLQHKLPPPKKCGQY